MTEALWLWYCCNALVRELIVNSPGAAVILQYSIFFIAYMSACWHCKAHTLRTSGHFQPQNSKIINIFNTQTQTVLIRLVEIWFYIAYDWVTRCYYDLVAEQRMHFICTICLCKIHKIILIAVHWIQRVNIERNTHIESF